MRHVASAISNPIGASSRQNSSVSRTGHEIEAGPEGSIQGKASGAQQWPRLKMVLPIDWAAPLAQRRQPDVRPGYETAFDLAQEPAQRTAAPLFTCLT